MQCPVIKPNEGVTDRVFRVILGSCLLVLAYFWLSGIIQVVLAVVGTASLVTGLVGYCGLYSLLGIATTKKKGK